MMSKRCQCCKQELEIFNFCKDKSQLDGFARRCKLCIHNNAVKNKDKIKEQKRKYFYKNYEQNIIKSRERYKQNKEANNKLNKDWYNRNKERKLAKNKEWRQSNLDRIHKLCQTHYKNNKHIYRERSVKRRTIEKQSVPKWANKKKIREIYKNCPKGLVVDHIVPLNSDFVCGLHVEHNLQYLTPLENSKKSNSVKHLEWKINNVNKIKS